MHYTKQKNMYLKNKFLNKMDCHMTHYLGMAANKMEHYCLVLCSRLNIETAQHKSKDQLKSQTIYTKECLFINHGTAKQYIQ